MPPAAAAAAERSQAYICCPHLPPVSSCHPQAHFSCHVCPPPVATHAYFNRAADLQRHMR